MAISVNDFGKAVVAAGLMSADEVKSLWNGLAANARPKNAEAFGKLLETRGKLTAFQAAELAAGNGSSLVLGDYLITGKIGAGGMGQVFKAQHRVMQRLVAIKLLPPAMTKDEAAVKRFHREVTAAAKLLHPNIVSAFDAGQAGAVHFLVMEYVDGKDLSATVKEHGPLPVNKAVNYILQAARGLEFAHGAGVIHRDIKPANLVLDKKGVVKVLDMGLARFDESNAATASKESLTESGQVMGTVDYMAPEQAMNTKHADARADIYSLGISLYYLLSGKPAYGGDTVMEKLMAHRVEPIPSLPDLQTTVSQQLDEIFKKMVAKMAADRYQTMTEVIDDLQSLGADGFSSRSNHGVVSTMSFSSEDHKKLDKQSTGKSMLTKVVASEKSKNFLAKVIGGSFVTIIAPVLVTFLVKYLEKGDAPAPPALPPAAAPQPAPVAQTPPATAPTAVKSDSPPAVVAKPASAAAEPNIVGASATAAPPKPSAVINKTSPVSTQPPAAASPAIPSKALTFGGHRYLLVTEAMQWNDAKAEAEAMGGHLATVTSREELEWIQQYIAPQLTEDQKRFYLGGIHAKGGAWEWVTGEPFSMDLWLGKLPDAKKVGSAKVITWWNNRWDDVHPDSVAHPFLVEWDTRGSRQKSGK